MNLDNLHNKLISAARALPADGRVPYAFEKRVMARLAETVRVDLAAAWASALWRGALACLVVTMLSGAWLLWSEPAANDSEFTHDFSAAVFASAGSTDGSPDEEAW
jgi:hypothetical protein